MHPPQIALRSSLFFTLFEQHHMRTLLLLCGGLGISLAAGAWACSDDTGTAATDYTSLLQTLTNDVALPAHAKFVTDADALVTSMTALQTTADATNLANAQAAWRTVRKSYRHLDALHFGPIADLGITDRIDVAPANATEIDPIVSGAGRRLPNISPSAPASIGSPAGVPVPCASTYWMVAGSTPAWRYTCRISSTCEPRLGTVMPPGVRPD